MRRLSFLFLLSLGAGLGAFVMSGPASQAHPLLDGGTFVPIAPQAVLTAAPTQMVVKAGDTLFAIGASLDRTWTQLAGWNHLSWSQAQLIMVGQVLKVPPVSYSPPAYSAPVAASVSSRPSYSGPSSDFQACVISHESGGNPNIYNSGGSGAWGMYQFMPGTYVHYARNVSGSGSYGSASAAQQTAVFNYAVAHGGAGNWAGDGC